MLGPMGARARNVTPTTGTGQILLRSLSAALAAGATLASLAPGCADQEGSASGGAGAGNPAQGLEAYALSSLGCSGPVHDGSDEYFGQCCVAARCFTPAEGLCPEVEPGTIQHPAWWDEPKACACTEIVGPFAANPDDPSLPEGVCCYLAGKIGCTGRALLVASAPRVARSVRRRDWLVPSSAATLG
jgi:hypothetical protein